MMIAEKRRRNAKLLISTATAALMLGSFAYSPIVQAQDNYPNKRITIVVPYPPGSTSDTLTRVLSPLMEKELGQTIVVENRSGASTSVGSSHVARSAADGYTVLIQAPNIVTNEYMFDGLDWTYRDFEPVTLLVRWSNLFVAGPAADITSFNEIISAGKKTDEHLTYGTPGIGSLSHLAIELLEKHTGFKMDHITYNGPAPMVTSLMGGHIKYGVTNPANFMHLIADTKNKITPVAVLSSKRDNTIPDIPSLGDYGITGIDSNGWLGILVPAGTPQNIVKKLNTAFVNALNNTEVQVKVKELYLESIGSSPNEFAEYLVSESDKWRNAIEIAGIQ